MRLNQGLGYDFNTVEFAVRDGIPYAIDFCNPAPDSSVESVGQENFDWVVKTMADYCIERAKVQVDGQDNLNWGNYIKTATNKIAAAPKAAAKKAAPKKAAAKKASPKAAK